MVVINPLFILILSLVLAYFFVITKNFVSPLSKDDQSVIGIIVTFTSVIFGLLLGFTVSNFWSRYVEINDYVIEEAQQLQQIYRIVKDFPNTENITGSIKTYVEDTIKIEWENLRSGKKSPENETLFKNIVKNINEYAKANPQSPILNNVYTLIPQRDKLKALTTSKFSTYLIWIIAVAAVVTLIGFWLLRNDNFYAQLIVDFGVIAIIALSLYLLVDLQNPFEGFFRIETQTFEELLNELNAN